MSAQHIVFVFLVSYTVTSAHASLQLVDDRGRGVEGTVEVCFQVATRNACSSVRGDGPIEVPPDFVSVRVEGPDHGPVSMARQRLKEAPNGDLLLALPRKARLQIVAGAEERLALSLFPQDDPSFRSAAFRTEVRGGATVKVPAGEHLVSLAGSGRAPDLHLLSTEPGGSGRLVYRARQGWSLVVRCRSERDGSPVQDAQVDLGAMEGFSAEDRPEKQVSGKRGLALFSGVSHLLASARVNHPRFVPHREEGISASAGTFAFREAQLEAGGTLRVEVTAEGKPLPGAECRVLEYDPNPRGPAPEPQVHFQATTDKAGTCRSGQLPPGPYTLRLAVQGNRSFLDRSVVITNGEETALNVPVTAIRVHGTVYRGTKPAPSYVAMFTDQDEIKPNATRRDAQAEGVADEEGEYETVLWSPGDYVAVLETPDGTPAGSKRIRLESAEEQVDFHLEEHDVAGTVVDERDKPIANAAVVLSWNRSHRLTKSDENGMFSFPLTEDGRGSIRALKPGYLEPPAVALELRPGAYPPPVVLRMKRTGLLVGKLLGAAGPAAGASLLSYRLEAGGQGTFLGMVSPGPDGRFELAAAEGTATRVFATGPGCPLTSFTLAPTEEELTLRCAEQPASLELRFTDTLSKPVPGKSVVARRDGVVIPEEVLSMHLSGLHLSTATDGGGRLLLVGLAPGNYDLYLAEATNQGLVAGGSSQGFLTTASLAPLTTSELEVTVEASP